MPRLAPPPPWPIPVAPAAPSSSNGDTQDEQQRRARQLDELRAQYPDALAWYGCKSGLWLAAPSGAEQIIHADSAAALAAMLADHYRRMIPRTSRPSRPSSAPRPGGTSAAARPVPRTVRAAARSTRTPTRYDRVRQWLGR